MQQPCCHPGEHLPSMGTHIFCPRSGCTRLGALTCACLQLSKAVNISEALQAWKRWRCFKCSPEPNQPIVGLINIPFVFLLCQKAAIKESERQTQAGLSLPAASGPQPPHQEPGAGIAAVGLSVAHMGQDPGSLRAESRIYLFFCIISPASAVKQGVQWGGG